MLPNEPDANEPESGVTEEEVTPTTVYPVNITESGVVTDNLGVTKTSLSALMLLKVRLKY
jgi:hypothetical protein